MFQKTSWVHRIWPSIAVGRRPRNSQVKRLSGFRPRVESLEDRCVMTLVAGMDGPLAVVADMPVCIDVLANDSTDNSQGLSIVDFTQGTNGYVSLNPDNTLSYVPFPGSNAPDAFNYTVTDGDDTTTATVYVNTPTAGESSYYAIYQAAVMQADQGFYSAVYAAASTAQASIESALALYESSST